MTTIWLRCPECGYGREVPRDKIPEQFKVVTCPHCRHQFPFSRPALSEETALVPFEARSIGALFDQAWVEYRQRWKTLVPLFLFTYLLIFIPVLLGLAAGFAAGLALPEIDRHLWAIGVLAGLGVGMLTMFWGYAAFIAAALDPALTIKSALGRARSLTGPFLWALSLSGLLMTGAFVLFFIPGIILAVWFAFVPFILVESQERGMSALKRSQQYVTGDWWDVFVKGLIATLIPSAVSAVPLVGPFIAMAAVPYALLMVIMIYRDQQARQRDRARTVSPKHGPLLWWGTAIAGYILFTVPFLVYFLFWYQNH
jgi:hypothetical protein